MHGALEGCWQSGDVILENAIADALLDALHRGFLSQGSGNQKEGQVLIEGAQILECVQARPPG
jgi:hypothetical protein